MAGELIPVMLNNNFNLAEFKRVVTAEFGEIDNYRFLIDAAQLNLEDEVEFNRQKSMITHDRIIFVAGRLRNRGNVRNTSVDTILADLPGVLNQSTKTNHECTVCYENNPCNTVYHTKVCDECFVSHFTGSNFQIIFSICLTVIPPETVFNNAAFCAALQSYSELQNLLKYIDFQVCTCGAVAINETMYPKQTCMRCFRDFCFFCNINWNNETMLNTVRYTCSSGTCVYETCIHFNLVTFSCNNTLQIPNRRCCPNCFCRCIYGSGCKYVKCSACNYEFCFFCLEMR
jgi:hypothetical protein